MWQHFKLMARAPPQYKAVSQTFHDVHGRVRVWRRSSLWYCWRQVSKSLACTIFTFHFRKSSKTFRIVVPWSMTNLVDPLVNTAHWLSFSKPKESNKYLISWFQRGTVRCSRLRLISKQDDFMETGNFCMTESLATTFTLFSNCLIHFLSSLPQRKVYSGIWLNKI
jgi:hypothetical protein